MIVTVNLAKGAIAMSKKRVIVKRLNAIQNLARWTCCRRQDRNADAEQDRAQLHLDIRPALRKDLRIRLSQQSASIRPEESARRGVVRHVEIARMSARTIIIDASMKFHSISLAGVFRSFSLRERGESGPKRPPRDCSSASQLGWRARPASTCSFARRRRGTRRGLRLLRTRRPAAKIRREAAGTGAGETRALNAEGLRVLAVAHKEIARPKASYSVAEESGLTLLVSSLFSTRQGGRRAALTSLKHWESPSRF